jgi:hypothetical protein
LVERGKEGRWVGKRGQGGLREKRRENSEEKEII